MTSRYEERRRVVITGMGVIAPNGQNLTDFWNSIRLGISAADYITRFDTTLLPSKIGAEVRDFLPENYMDAKAARRLERSQKYGVAAARLAADDAKLSMGDINADRCGIVEATSLSNVEAAYAGKDSYLRRGYRSVSPSAMVNGYVGSGSAEIANQLKVRGHAITMSSSSASGCDAMGYAMGMIQNEEIDVMVAGGSEAPLIDTVFAGFSQSRAMTRSNTSPASAMKPFDQEGDGFIMGEGAAYLILEELSHALNRSARIYAEVISHGRSCEAYHSMVPHPEGIGIIRALEKCLRQGGVVPDSIDYINAHGTATPLNDVAETRAIKSFFGAHSRRLSVSSTKPITGHPLAAAGALETVVCALALHHSEIPLTLNCLHLREECDLDYVQGRSRPYPIRAAISLNSGFGGKTSCLLLRRFDR